MARRNHRAPLQQPGPGRSAARRESPRTASPPPAGRGPCPDRAAGAGAWRRTPSGTARRCRCPAAPGRNRDCAGAATSPGRARPGHWPPRPCSAARPGPRRLRWRSAGGRPGRGTATPRQPAARCYRQTARPWRQQYHARSGSVLAALARARGFAALPVAAGERLERPVAQVLRQAAMFRFQAVDQVSSPARALQQRPARAGLRARNWRQVQQTREAAQVRFARPARP